MPPEFPLELLLAGEDWAELIAAVAEVLKRGNVLFILAEATAIAATDGFPISSEGVSGIL